MARKEEELNLFIGKTKNNSYLFLNRTFEYDDWMKWLNYFEVGLYTERQLEDRFDNYDWENLWRDAVWNKQTEEWLDDWVDSIRCYDWLTTVIDTSYCNVVDKYLEEINKKEETNYEYSDCIACGRFGNGSNNYLLNREEYEYVNEENFNKLLELHKQFEE